MVTGISSVQSSYNVYLQATQTYSKQTQGSTTSVLQDTLDLGASGPLSTEEAIGIVTERSLNKLLEVVQQARAELGLPEGGVLDTSPEATAQRITDFALGFFDKYLENNPGLEGEEARKQYAEFIGGAINQGVDEARGILNALSVLNPDVENHITSITDLIQQRLDAFVNGS
ncbi:MAG: DUF5610 domain-containing protein [Candidatus Hydrogenedentes bacterium]|nr:DUF5610 domain-containing protein [Candidatus Hydrogenedentota bacterium]